MADEEQMSKFAEMLENSDIGKWCRQQMAADAEDVEKNSEDEEVKEEAEDVQKDSEDEEEASEEYEDEDKPEKLKAQRDKARRQVAKFQRETEAIHEKLAALERKNRIAERKADLMQLEAEGFDIPSDEIENVADLEPARYAKHLQRIRKAYRRSPVGVNITPARVQDVGGKPVMTIDEVRRIADEVSMGRMTPDQARAAYSKGKVN